MMKFLLLALIGLGLGGGVWKNQNPQGTLDDFKSQAMANVERIKTGLDAGFSAVRDQPDRLAERAVEQEKISDRLATLEKALEERDDQAEQERLASLIDSELAETRSSIQAMQENNESVEVTVDQLQTSISKLESGLSDSLSSSLDQLESEVAQTSAGTEAGIVRLDAIDRRLELLVRRLDEQTIEQDMQTLAGSVETLQEQVEQLRSESRSEQTRLAIELAGLSERDETLGLRIDTIAGTAADTVAGLTNASPADETPINDNDSNSSNSGSGNTEAALLARTAGIDQRLSSIEAKIATVNTDSLRLATLTEQLDAANSRIAELEAQDESAKLSLASLDDSITVLQRAGESVSIDTVQAEIRDQLELAQARIDSDETNSDTSELEALLETTHNRIQMLEQRVQDLPASSSEADSALQMQSALQSQIAALQRRIEDVGSPDPALESTVQDVKEQLEQLSERQESKSVEYKIYFDRNSADVTEDAARVLNSFIAQEQNRTTGVSIFGFTDRSGSAAYNQQLALQRATNVRSYLIQNGLDFTKIKALSGLGEDAAAAVLPDEAADAEQRVVVLYADQP